MRPSHPALLMGGFASSVAAAAAVLPPTQPLERDPVMLMVIWATAAFTADGLARAGHGRFLTALTALLTLASLITLGIESVRQRRWEQPGIVLALIAVGIISLVPILLRWWLDRWELAAAPSEPASHAPGPEALDPEDLEPLRAAGGATRLLRPSPTRPRRVLHDRWLLEPGPLAGADQGGFSVLCRAVDLRQRDRKVVVKLASRSFGIKDDSVARLLREREMVSALDSPYVIGLRDSGWEAGVFFIVLDYYPAGSLARWLERRFVLELSLALKATCELLRALAYLHEGLERPTIHRDVTPRNVLIRSETPTLRLLVSDFGSARRLHTYGPTTDTGVTVGSVFSPYYAPPELVGGPHHNWWGPETDVYGACAILYELLTGLPPYQREARRRQMDFQRLVLDPMVAPTPPGHVTRGLPPILDDVISAGLAHDPGARPARAADLLPLLEEIGRREGSLRIPFADLRSRP